jgi:predicted ATP-binding protein involved in virulence
MKKRDKTRNVLTLQWNSREGEWHSIGEPREQKILQKNSHLEGNLSEVIKDFRNQFVDNFDANANLPLAIYYPVNRAVLDIPLEIPEEHLFKQIDAYDQALTGVQIGFGSFFQWFRALEDLENEERRDEPDYRNRQLEAVRQAIYLLLFGFSNLRVRRSPLRMTINKQGQELIINQLSDGEKGLLALAGDLARRLAIANPSLPDPLQGSGVVLIDEIELHLHPKWQREIIPALTRTFPNCQFIITTHSPQVISEVKPDGIYILERTDDGIVAMRPESSYGRDTNRILEDLMDTPERPQEIKESLLELFRLIAKGELDSARQLHQKIADKIGADEPELVGASVSIRRREILGR